MLKRLGLAGALFASAGALSAITYTVTSTADAGAGTLRQSILDANASPGADTIAFAVVGTGPHTISLASTLPDITEAVTIDGYTQPGASANTHSTDQGLDTVLQIEVEAGNLGPCIVSKASGVTIRGLAIYHCNGAAIQLLGAVTNNVVAGNFIGTKIDGTTLPANGNVSAGVSINLQTGARVGGTTPADRNLLSGNNFGQVSIAGGSGHLIQGNLIGMKPSGLETLRAVGDSSSGVAATAGTGLVIGGPTAAARNVFGNLTLGVAIQGTAAGTIQGNFFGTDVTGQRAIVKGQFINDSFHGIDLLGSGLVEILGNTIGGYYQGIVVSGGAPVIQGNFIGTDATGILDLGMQKAGIEISTASGALVGGIAAGEGNIIAYSGKTSSPSGGVVVNGGTTTIRGNSIYNNPQVSGTGGLGIDLVVGGAAGVTPNDPGDSDSGPNGRQNFPVLTSAAPALPQGSGTRVQGTLNSTAATTFDLDFYSICNLRPAELLEGKTYIGSIEVTTDGSGNIAFDEVLPVTIAAGELVTATATDPGGNTSEFSQQLVFTGTPPLGPAAGGTMTTLKGMLFEDGATVTVGGVPATNVDVVDAQTITSTMPALPPGSINDVVVSNPSGSSGALTNGWAAAFLDVTPGNIFYSAVWLLVHNDITAGVGGGNYGINDSTLRQQMAVFLLKGKHGVCYTPPPCTGVFPDVPCPSNFAPWIEALAAEGITGGCAGGNYCPGDPVLRQQMAVFLLKARHGAAYVPPPCSGDFADVPCPGNPFANWIEQLAAENITGGCGGANFCPTNAVTRGQMSAFLSLAFKLQ